MGLFSKKEACPVCGGEVKGLFLKKIADKKTLCKTCSKAISMEDELLKNAQADFVKTHIAYRKENAALYATTDWEAKYRAISLHIGVNREKELIFISHSQMDNEDNPTVLSFDEITGYELYKMKTKLDDATEPGDTPLETTLGALGAIVSLASSKDSNNSSYYILKLDTTNEYWPQIKLKLTFTDNQMFGPLGDHNQMRAICQAFKRIVRKEAVELPEIIF